MFFIKPGYANIEISLVSYSAVTPGVFLPQAFRDGTGGFFSAGGPHFLSVGVYDTWQVDGLCGGYRREDLTPGNIGDYEPRTFIYTYSGATGFFFR